MVRTAVPALLLLAALLLGGCSVNPVTGDRELVAMGEDWELQVGAQQYAPLIQAQGGDYELDPDLVDYVQRIGQRLAAESDRDLPYEFEVINESIPNAWALPGGKIAINRGLLVEMQSESELAAVLSHEIVHAAARHGALGQTRNLLLQGAVLAGGIAVGAATEDDRYTQVALLGGSIGAQLVNQSYSREAEREADLYGMRYMKRAGYSPVGAVELQETFVRLSEGRNDGGFGALFASHPPSQERVENNRELLAELGREGEIGREDYQRRIAKLRADQPAYAAYDEGRKALADEDVQTALTKADEAIRMLPEAAIFHSLRGDALAAREDFREAERAYDRAVRRDSTWFYHHLRRGMARNELERFDAARGDLNAANELMPTAISHYLLGTIEQRAGNRSQAIEHYQVAAQAQTPVGQQARERLQSLGVAPSG